MEAAAALAALKLRLGITSDTFDTQLEDFLEQAAKRLYPIAQYEVPMQLEDVSVDAYGEAVVDLSALTTPVLSARFVEASEGYTFYPANSTHHHGNSLYVRELSPSVTQLRVYGVTSFILSNVPDYLELAVLWYAMSEFYNLMASSDSNYNIYMQTSGARSVDNMRSEAAFYEQQANVFLNDRAQLYGLA